MAPISSRFLIKLKQRKIYRIAVGYGVAGVAILSAAEVILDPIGLEGVRTPLVVLVLVGFPIALGVGWITGREREETGVSSEDGLAPHEEEGLMEARRIAVLPFRNISQDPGDEYFAEGMTEELISVLSRIPGLDVIARTSVMPYQTDRKGAAQIAKELSVGTILDGSVRKAGKQVRITTQLIDCRSESHIWAEDYDRELLELFQVQGDIAQQVARSLELKLLIPDIQRIERRPTTDLDAYDRYLLGRYQLNRRTEEGIRKAMALFESAIEIDPEFALAHAALGESLVWTELGYCLEPPPNALQRGMEAAHRAVTLDDRLPEARIALSFAALHCWEFDTAEEEAKRAIELGPSHAEAHQRYAWCMSYGERFSEGVASYERALELDPRSVVLITESGWPLSYLGKHELAMERYREAILIDPNFPTAYLNMGWSYQRMGKLAEARPAYEKGLALSGRAAFSLAWYVTFLVESGEETEAKRALTELMERQERGEKVAAFIALGWEALGDQEETYEWLERSYRDREPTLAWILASPELGFRSIWGDRRFSELKSRIRGGGLPGVTSPSSETPSG